MAHGLAYDTDRHATVLFGGLTGFVADGDASLASRLAGDTWELPDVSTAPDLEVVIGKATAVFPRNGSLERLGEAAIGNLVADAMRDRYGTDIAIVTAGELRAPLPSNFQAADHALHRPDAGYVQSAPFDVVAGDMFSILPFGNIVFTRRMTGALLWAVLEHSVAAAPNAVGAFAQLSGLSMTYQLSAPAGGRIRSVRLDNGTAIPADAQVALTVAISSFADTGGDGYGMLASDPGIPQETMADVLLAYIRRRGSVTPSTSGRITQIP